MEQIDTNGGKGLDLKMDQKASRGWSKIYTRKENGQKYTKKENGQKYTKKENGQKYTKKENGKKYTGKENGKEYTKKDNKKKENYEKCQGKKKIYFGKNIKES